MVDMSYYREITDMLLAFCHIKTSLSYNLSKYIITHFEVKIKSFFDFERNICIKNEAFSQRSPLCVKKTSGIDKIPDVGFKKAHGSKKGIGGTNVAFRQFI